LLLHRLSKHSLNIRSAFIHIISDAVSSVGVVLGGVAIILYDFYLIDTLLTLGISIYILVQTYQILRQTIHILMQGVPEGMDLEKIGSAVREVEGVEDVHHLHVWQMDERSANLEAHIVINQCDFQDMNRIKVDVKQRLQEAFHISHTTLEFEFSRCQDCLDDNCYEGPPNRS
jgi:cobalt-zinc-cadmium efflux system protein